MKSHRVENKGEGIEDDNLLRQSITSLFDRNMRWKNTINESKPLLISSHSPYRNKN